MPTQGLDGSGYVQAVAHGGVVIAGISQSHRPEVDIIFGYLIGGDAAPVWMAIDVASVMIAVALAIFAWRAFWDARWRFGFLEAGLLILLFAAVPPLVGFAFTSAAFILPGISGLSGKP